MTFWGAQWWRLNHLSGGPAPASFKGFANSPNPNPPDCGGTWQSDPGNSSGPPESVPADITVIVSSLITKSGPIISGDVPKMVIVHTDPGYYPNPGHEGTGTVTAVVCQSWRVIDVADVNRDGHLDYALFNAGTRQTAVWYLNNNVYIGGAYAPTLPVGWRVIDVADFNRDGHPDYALFNASTRQTAIWYLLGSHVYRRCLRPDAAQLAGNWSRPVILTTTESPITSFTMRARTKQRSGT